MGEALREGFGRLLRKGDYIFGSYVKPEAVDGYINGVNPSDRSDVLGRFPFSERSVDHAVEYAAMGYRVWRRLSINDRAAAVHRFREQLLTHQEALAHGITREAGKPLWEARQEVTATIRGIDLLLDDGIDVLAPRVVDEVGARSDRLPRGVVAILCPYNFPLMVAVLQTARRGAGRQRRGGQAQQVHPRCRSGAHRSVGPVSPAAGYGEHDPGPGSVVGTRLATHPDVDLILFTGRTTPPRRWPASPKIGPSCARIIHCGGKGTAIVLDDAELDRAVYEVMVGAFLTAGQRHNSTGRVIVTDGVYDAFIGSIVEKSRALHVGSGFDASVFMGPVISENLRTRYRRFARSMAGQGHILLPPEPVQGVGKGFYVRPCIIGVDWERGAPVLGGEPPGPTLLVYRVRDWQEAIALHNQVEARISTSLFTDRDNPTLDEFRERLRTGALNVNRGTIAASLRLPSIGLGTSSNGLGGGVGLLEHLTHPRSQLTEVRAFASMPKLPGVVWESDGRPADQLPVNDDPTELGDLSNYLEMASD